MMSKSGPRPTEEAVYLDASATTPVEPLVLEAMEPFWTDAFANPSAPHAWGAAVEKRVQQCRRFLAQRLGCGPEGIIFTSGGTEANNLALQGSARMQPEGRHAITTAIEHPSVLRVMEYLESTAGWRVTVLPVNRDGIVTPEAVAAALEPATRLVSIMQVNNEIGSINPVTAIGQHIQVVNQKRPRSHRIRFHVDAVQAVGRLPLPSSADGVDLLSISGHKIGGPKGSGLLFCRSGIQLQPLLLGGGQENGLRAGTENVPGIIGLTKAYQLAEERRSADSVRLQHIHDNLREMAADIPGSAFNSPADGAPHILNVRFEGVPAAILIHYLEQDGILASVGAACSTQNQAVSHVLTAIGCSEAEAQTSVRLSFAAGLTDHQLVRVRRCLPKAVEAVRAVYEGSL